MIPQRRRLDSSSRTQLALLGTGTPNPDPERQGAGYLILVDQQPYLFDVGPGVVRRAAALTASHPDELERFSVSQLSRAFLTHLHADHTAGLPDLLLTPWIAGRNRPLEVWGPPGTERLVSGVQTAYQADIDYRLTGLEPADSQGWKTAVHEYGQGVIYRDERIQVEAFRVCHGAMPHCFGFRVSTPDRVIVLSGDTRPCENVVTHSQEADILVHEVYAAKALQRRPAVWQRYHRFHHTSALELAELAGRVQPQLLILTHALLWGAPEADLLEEIQSEYAGPVVMGADLDLY